MPLRRISSVVPVLLLALGGGYVGKGAVGGPPQLPVVVANDNREPAGQLEDGELRLDLVVRMARWYPEAEDGPWTEVAAFGVDGGPPQIPAPLIRAPAGTSIVVRIRNGLPDSTLYVSGLMTRPAAHRDSVAIPPGETRTVRFEAGAPGTYLYAASAGVVDYDAREREQLAGAFVVDAPGALADDRIFVINIWGEPRDSTSYRNAVAINGKSWPYTERLAATVGDSLRWRVINASIRNHPMHLHGFYFEVATRGSMLADTAFSAAERRLVVTEDMSPAETMTMAWRPERPGNWLFHCHLSFHVVDEARLDAVPAEHGGHSAGPGRHMAGLVLGITVRPPPGSAEPERGSARALRLYVNEGARRGRAPRALGYVLQRDGSAPAPDSVEIPGSTLVLTRDEPTDITVVNQLREPAAIHWHGIELESYSDGVAGWSGSGGRLAPAIAPGDSFTARLDLPRAGTFIYHTHLNDIEQVTSGLYGAILVLEPGQELDPETDHLFVAGWDGPDPPHILVNGSSGSSTVRIGARKRHRLRFVNIGPAARLIFALRHDSAYARWRPVAKDGADLPEHRRSPRIARQRVAVGETFDFEFTPPAPGFYELAVGLPGAPPSYIRRFDAR